MLADRNENARIISGLMRQVERLTGLTSRWNGLVNINEETDFHGNPPYLAKKDWSCSITVHESLPATPDSFATLIHESLHSVSVGLEFSAFRDYRGYEEGVVEKLTRLLAPSIAEETQVGIRIEQRDSFNGFINHLERLRELTAQSEMAFYLALLATPLASREQTVIQWVMRANPEEKDIRLLARIGISLRSLRGH